MIGGVALLLGLTGLLAALPMAPAFVELYQRRDTKPIPVKNRTEMVVDVAQDFRSLLEGGSEAARRASPPANTMVLETDWFVEQGRSILNPIYAKGRLAGSGNNVFDAIFCEKDVDLGKHAQVLSWVHAEGAVMVPSGSTIHGRLSAGEHVELGTECSFERVHAPVVMIAGGAMDMDAEQSRDSDEDHPPSRPRLGLVRTNDEAPLWNPEPINILELVTERLFVPEDFVLQPGRVLRKNVVARGRIHLAEASHVIGCLKSNHDMELAPNVRIEGSLVSATNLRIGRGCFVMGPVLAEGELVIESGTRIGTPTHPTTVQAPRIRIAPGVTLHGSLFAPERGRVTG